MARPKTSLTMRVRIEGVRETLKALNELPKEANEQMRKAAMTMAEKLAVKSQQAALSDQSPQAALIVPTIKPRRDRVPVIVAGGSTRVGRRSVPAWKVLFGSEFGANQYPQFGKRHQGQEGSYLFPIVEANSELVEREWNAAADDVIARFTAGGGG